MKYKGGHYYWALMCGDLICGVYASKKEAEETNAHIKECVVKHKIKRCTVVIDTK